MAIDFKCTSSRLHNDSDFKTEKNRPSANFIFLQWLVVDRFQRCNLKSLFRQTRPSSPDSPPLKEIQFRYQQVLKNN